MEHESQEGGGAAGRAEIKQACEASRIKEGIAEALRDGSAIDHETAWPIAKAITPGRGALYQLALTGEISPDIGGDLEVAYEVLSGEPAQTWVAALDGYCFRRRDKGPISGWPEQQGKPRSEQWDVSYGTNDTAREVPRI